MIKTKLNQFRSVIASIMFGAMFLLLPVSSFPVLSKVFGGTSVAPLSVIPAIILVILLVLPTVFKYQLFSAQFKPLILFFLSALISTFFAFFRNMPSFRDTHFLKNAIESVITLLMGFAFYYLCAHFLTTEEKIAKALQWLNIGAIFMIVFSALQTVFIRTPVEFYPAWLGNLIYKTSSSGKIFPRRISGFAFEPSWLAHQLNILYLPVWLGFSVKGYSVFKARLFKRFTVENLFLLAGIVMLFLSFSRIGWITFGVLIVYLSMRFSNTLLNKAITHLETKRNKQLKRWQYWLLKMTMWIAVLLGGVCLALIAGFVISKLDKYRTADILNFEAMRHMGILGWANLIKIAERLVYWIIGFRTFQLHPWIGVGLGAIGYFFSSTVPSFGYRLPDVVHFMNYENFIPNAKNIWSRILGETGIIGTALFISWLYLQWKAAAELEKENHSTFYQSFGLVGKLVVIAFIFEGFSMDTFGLPYYWIAFGLVVAAWRILKNDSKTPEFI